MLNKDYAKESNDANSSQTPNDQAHRKAYWNKQYTDYFVDRIKESNKNQEIKTVKNDVPVVTDKLLFEMVQNMRLSEGQRVLDFGCGYCRLYPFLKSLGVDYYGIDISESMIALALNTFPELSEKLTVIEGESLPFEQNFFDAVICFGVFDACYQEQALAEIIKCLKIGGLALVTGKNSHYFNDDEKAEVAEINARAKGHPNYFTDVHCMLTQLEQNHLEIEDKRFYKYRGDMAAGDFSGDLPSSFYEWALLIRKSCALTAPFAKFSDAFSSTFREKYPNKV